jgi:hypothetical protein
MVIGHDNPQRLSRSQVSYVTSTGVSRICVFLCMGAMVRCGEQQWDKWIKFKYTVRHE